jgi:hypothetical protein
LPANTRFIQVCVKSIEYLVNKNCQH